MENLLKFPPGKRHQIVLHVRRDPQFAPQLYFLSTEEERGWLFLTFEQAIWDTGRNQVTSVVFNKRSIFAASDALHCAIDEKERCMYIVYNSGTKLTMQRLSIKYEKPDKLGYRYIPQISLTASDSTTFSFKQEICKTFSFTAISVCPSTGQLILHRRVVDNRSNPHGSASCLTGTTSTTNDFCSATATVISVTISLGLSVIQQLEVRSHLFSPSNDLLVLLGYRTSNPPSDAIDKEAREKLCKDFPVGSMILYSDNAQMGHINTLRIDPVQLLQSFLPKTMLDGLKAGCGPALVPDLMFFGANLQLLGHLHKYVVFFFHHKHVLAAKWPKDWYKMQQIPHVHQKRVMCVVDKQKQKRHGHITDVWLVSTDLYFKFEKSGAEAIWRMSLGHMFKDYRTCAFCGKEEKGKWKNKDGKRMSSFKSIKPAKGQCA